MHRERAPTKIAKAFYCAYTVLTGVRYTQTQITSTSNNTNSAIGTRITVNERINAMYKNEHQTTNNYQPTTKPIINV